MIFGDLVILLRTSDLLTGEVWSIISDKQIPPYAMQHAALAASNVD